MKEHSEARYIVETLQSHGYTTYYAGGWVRDYLLQKDSDDIDIATSAPPETVRSLFKKTIPVGIQFGIVLVIINNRQYEVATFRSDLEYKDGRRPTKIAFTTAKEDALRRDFTINGMFYDPLEEKLIDFVEGQKDLQKKLIRAIGDPHKRIQEDRLRMIRAIRLSFRFNFTIDPTLEQAISFHVSELFPAVAMERVSQEFTKMTYFSSFKQALIKMYDLKLLQAIFPKLSLITTEEFHKRIFYLDNFPKALPLIVYINELFDQNTLQEALSLVKYLKLSNYEMDFITYLFRATKLHQSPKDFYEWAHLYAHPFSDSAVHILAAKTPLDQRRSFLQEYEKRKQKLQPHVVRIQTKDPCLKAEDLIKQNIKPGILLGQLLKQGEKIAINENISDKKSLIEALKKTDLWPSDSR